MGTTLHPATQVVHCGREDCLVPPIDLSTTTRIDDLNNAISSIEQLNQGNPTSGNPIYSRLHNDSVARFEQAFAQLEEAEAAVAFSSGMAAISALVLDIAQQRGHIIAIRPIYGGTDHLLSSSMCSADVSWCTPENFASHLRSNTKLIMIETPANPTCSLLDIEDIVQRANGVPVSVDSTFASPILQQPLRFGAAYSVHSATKFIGGHSDVLGGVIACSNERARALRKIRIYTGGCLHPLSGYLLHRGLQTLHLRVTAAQQNAVFLAKKLRHHPAIADVFHPSVPDCDPQHLVGRQMSGPGSMMAITLHGGFSKAASVLKQVKTITPAVSLGSVETLIQHPAGLTHRNSGSDSRKSSGITDSMLRISVGIEHGEDLWDDLEQALNFKS